MKRKVLVIAPHADDEILGCGGVIARHIHNGDSVDICVATNASRGAPELFSSVQIETIRAEAEQAHRLLGVNQTNFLEFPAPDLENFPAYKIANTLSDYILRIKPSDLYLPFPGDLHTDHRVIYRAALVAARPPYAPFVKKILCYETLSETEWTPKFSDTQFSPNVFVDIENFIDLKAQAMECFKSQIKEEPNPRSINAIKALSRFRGSTVNCRFAEAFMLERLIDRE